MPPLTADKEKSLLGITMDEYDKAYNRTNELKLLQEDRVIYDPKPYKKRIIKADDHLAEYWVKNADEPAVMDDLFTMEQTIRGDISEVHFEAQSVLIGLENVEADALKLRAEMRKVKEAEQVRMLKFEGLCASLEAFQTGFQGKVDAAVATVEAQYLTKIDDLEVQLQEMFQVIEELENRVDGVK